LACFHELIFQYNIEYGSFAYREAQEESVKAFGKLLYRAEQPQKEPFLLDRDETKPITLKFDILILITLFI